MPNMELIEAKTLVSATSSVTFTSIPQTYTDLKISVSGRTTGGVGGSGELGTISFSFGSTSYTYSDRFLGGNGTAPYSSANSVVATSTPIYWVNGSGSTASTFASVNIDIPNYTLNNAKNFSYEATPEYNDSTLRMMLGSISTTKTDAVTEIILTAGQTAFAQHTTFYLYGISNVTSTAKATGGIVSSDETYWYHMFPYSSTFTPITTLTADYLVIAGGGGGWVGGGGAGGYRTSIGGSPLSLTATSYSVTVGAGGAPQGGSGNNSIFSTITSTGGGAGAGGVTVYNGGSGGGGSNDATNYGTGNAGGYTPSEGNNGGSRVSSTTSGGGGGAGAVGGNASGTTGGAGGAGSNSASTWAIATQTGVNGYYAGGGGGGGVGGGGLSTSGGGLGGLGGGGNAEQGGVSGRPGVANTGSGGGGQYYVASTGNGGSGLVIIRYAK